MAPDQELVVADELEIDFPLLAGQLPEKAKLLAGPILKNGIKPVHEAFADYMLVNPGCTLRAMSAYFKYSPSWICQVINSDMFQAYFAQRRQGVVVSIAQDLPSRLAAAAHLATERVIEVLETSSDPELVIDAFDKVLHRHGYAPNAKGMPGSGNTNIQNNVFYLAKEELAQAREKLINSHQEKEPEAKGNALLPAPS